MKLIKTIASFMLAVSCLLMLPACGAFSKQTLFVSARHGYNAGLTLGEYKVSQLSKPTATDINIMLNDSDDVEDFWREMKKCTEFVSETELFIYGEVYRGFYYYQDRNSYFLFCRGGAHFSAVNLQTYDINFGSDGNYINPYFPIPGLLMIYPRNSEYYEEQLVSELSEFFENISYNDAVEFYKPYPSGFVTADPLAQTLSITAYINGAYSETEKGIIDFKNQNIGFIQADGTTLWLS